MAGQTISALRKLLHGAGRAVPTREKQLERKRVLFQRKHSLEEGSKQNISLETLGYRKDETAFLPDWWCGRVSSHL